MNQEVTCIIPFYNENENLLNILKMLQQTNKISQIICVDDGSTNDLTNKITKLFPTVELICNKVNIGKAGSVFKAIDKSNNKVILLLDADLKNLSQTEIDWAINKFASGQLDMIILENKGDNYFIDSILRKTILQSGKRVLTRNDLIEIKKMNPRGYQLEVAINRYMMNNNKRVAWIKSSSFNPHKKKKLGYVDGIIQDNKMTFSIIKYIGLGDYLKQMLFFARKQVI